MLFCQRPTQADRRQADNEQLVAVKAELDASKASEARVTEQLANVNKQLADEAEKAEVRAGNYNPKGPQKYNPIF